MPSILLISIATVTSTFLGGLFALRQRDKLHLVLGFSAGAVVGVAFFDLLPEALELTDGSFSTATVTSCIALGFILFMILDRIMIFYGHHDDEPETTHGHNHGRGILGAGSLAIHSFIDGLAIGLAFQVSAAVGAIVATAVLVHDFSDGINTVNVVLKNHGSAKQALRWLMIDAGAPAAGALCSLFFTPSAPILGIILSVFCGFFLYIGASDLLPESHHRHPTVWTTVATVCGMATLYAIIQIAKI